MMPSLHIQDIAQVTRCYDDNIVITWLYDGTEYKTYQEALAQYEEDCGVDRLVKILYSIEEFSLHCAMGDPSPRDTCRRVYRHLAKLVTFVKQEGSAND